MTNNRKIHFQNETSDIISEILKKYNLEETTQELVEKIFSDKPFFIRGGIILECAVKLVKKEVTEKDVIARLEKDFNVSKEIAKSITNDIKDKLVSIASLEPSSNISNNSMVRSPTKEERVPSNFFPSHPTLEKKNEINVSNFPSLGQKKEEIVSKNNIPSKRLSKYQKEDPYREKIE